MSLIELFIIAVGLSMDAFAVSICKGLSMQKMSWKNAVIVGLYFGGFQAGMPLIGYILGSQFKNAITSIDHWIAFILLGIIGFNMIRESLNQEEECVDCSVSPGNMILLAIATSIDALAVGVTFAFMNIQLIPSVTIIGVTTFLFSAVGIKAGGLFGNHYKSKAELVGGIVLILIGVKILLQGLGII